VVSYLQVFRQKFCIPFSSLPRVLQCKHTEAKVDHTRYVNFVKVGGLSVKLQAFFTSALHGRKRTASYCDSFTLSERVPHPVWTWQQTEISLSLPETEPRSFSP